jgi:hypothetical protein
LSVVASKHYYHFPRRQITVELFRWLAALQSPLMQWSGFGIHNSNLSEARVALASYNEHVRLLSPEPLGWLKHHQIRSGLSRAAASLVHRSPKGTYAI